MEQHAGIVPADEACRMLDLMQSVGTERFVLTWRAMDDQITKVRKHWTSTYIHRTLSELLEEAGRDRLNLFMRPYSSRTSLIQLDDLTDPRARELEPVSFMTLKTSPAKSQAWIALAATQDADDDKDFRRRVKKAAQSDPMASGSVRIAGSLNFKEKYGPEFPRVSITHGAQGRLTTRERLSEIGLVAPARSGPFMLPRKDRISDRWPDYQRCLDDAPLNQDKAGPDRSSADFTWCKIAMELFRHGEQDTAAELLEVSAKAQERGERYARDTARSAARAIEGVRCR